MIQQRLLRNHIHTYFYKGFINPCSSFLEDSLSIFSWLLSRPHEILSSGACVFPVIVSEV